MDDWFANLEGEDRRLYEIYKPYMVYQAQEGYLFMRNHVPPEHFFKTYFPPGSNYRQVVGSTTNCVMAMRIIYAFHPARHKYPIGFNESPQYLFNNHCNKKLYVNIIRPYAQFLQNKIDFTWQYRDGGVLLWEKMLTTIVRKFVSNFQEKAKNIGLWSPQWFYEEEDPDRRTNASKGVYWKWYFLFCRNFHTVYRSVTRTEFLTDAQRTHQSAWKEEYHARRRRGY